ncbi:hypothetical protein GGX14DRAFT_568839 [Mycena pura]|uniref:Uncharacterized protein n=1 Tax=Mycena pura TaxID=153505 RepID=A0AAD6V8X4_9AGAR|nr:hypothetical protein GGX14DRAFT_568839 [Mycena pura]
MVRFNKETLVTALVLGFYPPGVLSTITMTGPSSAVANSFITATWTSAPNDPASFKFEIDWAVNSLQQSDNFFITQFMDTAAGSATFQIPEFAVGTHRIEVSSNDGSTIYSESSIEIVSVEEPFETVSTAMPFIATATATLSTSIAKVIPISSGSAATEGLIQLASSSSSSSQSLSPSTSSSSSQSSASQSQTAPSEANKSRAQVVTRHNNVGAIAGGAAGGTVVVLLALLGLWYLRRRRRAAEIRQFMAVPFLVSTGSSEMHRGTDANNYGSKTPLRFILWAQLIHIPLCSTIQPTSHFGAPSNIVRFSKGMLGRALVLGLYAPRVLSTITMTGPSSAVSNSLITVTWTNAPDDPTSFEIDIDWALNSLQQSDSYAITQFINTADGSAAIQLPDFEVGTHRIAISSNDGFTVYSESSIEIVPVGEPPEPTSSSTQVQPASTTTSSPSPSPSPPLPPPPRSSTVTSPRDSPPKSSSSSQSSSIQSQSATTSSVTDQESSSASLSPSASQPTSSSTSQSSISQSQAATSVPDQSLSTSGAQFVTHQSNARAGAIAGGVIGGILMVLLALPGWWYLRRRRRRASPSADMESLGSGEIRQLLAVPVSTASAVHRGADGSEYRASSSTAGATEIISQANDTRDRDMVDSDGVTDTGTSTSTPHTQSADDGPSREELLEEVNRLREVIGNIAPPEYSG